LVKHQTSTKPAFNSTDLSEVVLSKLAAGTRQRQISRQNLNAFLEYSVNRLNFKGCWAPPKAPREKRPSKRVGYPLSDEQILKLLDGLPTTEAADRWRFAIELLATYGLRPDELRYLKLRKGAEGAELWCTYSKVSGGGQTMQRRLSPLHVTDQSGQRYDWKLSQRIGLGEELPPLGKPGKGGEALGTYLRRLAVWKALQAEAEKSGETLTPYSFRHRFAQQSHQAGIALVHIAEAMGHSIAVHLTSYARFTPSGTAAAYAQINK
jgi:integrase